MIQTIQGSRNDVRVLVMSAGFRGVMQTLMQMFNERMRCAKMNPEVRAFDGDITSVSIASRQMDRC